MRYKRQDTPAYEIWIYHQPFTGSAKGKPSYKQAVAEAAGEEIESPIISDDVEVDVIYSTSTMERLQYDVDNILKPTLDGLEGVAYENDRQVRSVCSTRFDATEKHFLEGNVEHVEELFYSAKPHVVLIRIFSDTELEKLGGAETIAEKRRGKVLARLDELYLAAMEEVEADTRPIRQFVTRLRDGLSPEQALAPPIPESTRHFVLDTLLTCDAPTLEVAASFLLGREDLIPAMFQRILEELERSGTRCDSFRFYLDRHVLLDAEVHAPLAKKLLANLCGEDPANWARATTAARAALRARRLV